MLQCCVRRRLSPSVVCKDYGMYCGKMVRTYRAKNTIHSQPIGSRIWKSIGTKINDLDFCLEVVKGHVNRCVTFAIEYLRNR